MGNDCLWVRSPHHICGSELNGRTWPTSSALHCSLHSRHIFDFGKKARGSQESVDERRTGKTVSAQPATTLPVEIVTVICKIAFHYSSILGPVRFTSLCLLGRGEKKKKKCRKF